MTLREQFYRYRLALKEQMIDYGFQLEKEVDVDKRKIIEGKIEVIFKIIQELSSLTAIKDDDQVDVISYELYCKIHSFQDNPETKGLYDEFYKINDLKNVIYGLMENKKFAQAATILLNLEKTEQINREKISG